MSAKITKQITVTGLFTALVWIATIIFTFSLPASGGFFNMGEAVIYVAALLFGPRIAAFSGGVGAMLGDLTLGYSQYALGTLAIKAIEGYLVGYLFFKLKTRFEQSNGKQLTSVNQINIIVSGISIAAMIVIIGTIFFSQDLWLLIVLSVVMLASVIIAVLFSRSTHFHAILAISAGAVVMITGYFMYSTFAFTWFDNLLTGGTDPLINYQAYVNIPFDILQCLVGEVIAIPVYQAIGKASVLERL